MGEDYKMEEILSAIKELKDYSLTHEEIQHIRELLKKARNEEDLKKAVKTKATTNLVWAIIVGGGSTVWYVVQHWLKGNM